MRKLTLLVTGALLLALSLGAVAAERCQYSAPRDAELDAAGLKALAIEIGPDDLTVQGQPGLAKIVVRGTACASNPKWLPDLLLDAKRTGDTAHVIARNAHHGVMLSLFGGGSYAYLKLDVRVPPALAVQLAQGSGNASASGIASLDATLGSGDLKANAIAGRLGLRVGSGDVVARGVGSLDLASLGSGDVDVEGVRGSAQVGSVGSGDLGLRNVTGGASIGAVASGDVKLASIGGAVNVRSVGSGDLGIDGVKGDVTVGAVASGDVRIRQAGGNVRADSVGSGDFGADGVAGDFSVGAVGSGDVHHSGVKGKVSVPRGSD